MAQSQQFSLFLGPHRVPLDITLLAVDDGGQSIGVGRKEFSFHFRYRGLGYSARFCDDGKAAMLDLSARLGPIPFSAESLAQRQALSSALKAVNADLGPVLSAQQGHIALATRLALPVPVTAVGLLSALAQFFLRLRPYLDLMAMIRMM